MRRILLTVFLALVCVHSISQTIIGTVYDEQNGKPISYAAVFVNGSTTGTYTDQNGNFSLVISESGKLPVAVSAIGYHSLLLSDYSAGQPLRIVLTPKTYELKEIVVSTKRSLQERRIRNENLRIFRQQFLGESLNSNKCTIENENDLTFHYLDDVGILTAECDKPLLIRNEALGYIILYYLDTFKYSPSGKSLKLLGTYIFRENISGDESARVRIIKKRQLAYSGSRMHFFRALWNNDLDSAGFEIKDINNNKLKFDSLVVQNDDGNKFLKSTGFLNISYYSKVSRTQIELLQPYVLFDRSGYFDPYGISWKGEMTRERISDLLPFDYRH